MRLAAGMRLGPYEVLGPLGAGGMGEVYRARDSRLGRDVAIKIIAENLEAHPTARARFDREWRTVARLSHPNVLSVHDVGQHDGVTFAVTELVAGESLRRRLIAGPLAAQKALDFGIQIARGLAAAHQAGIVHRDLKPENIVVTPDGQLKILDFGLARLQDPTSDFSNSTAAFPITESGLVLGTRGYMAPEQARGEVADHRADIFAFGALLYEMLTGDRAFGGASPVEVLHAVIAKEPDAARLSSTNAAVRRIVARCLEKRREERFTSAHDLAYALEAAGDTLTASGSAPAQRITTPSWYHHARAAIVAVTLLASGAVAGFLFTRDSPSSRAAGDAVAVRAQIEAPPGSLGEVSFSPDGRRLAAITFTAGQATAWVRDLDGVDWRRVAVMSVPWDSSWFQWSPDNSAILYPASESGVARLRVVNVATGATRTVETETWVRDANGRPDSTVLLGANVGGAWSQASGLLIGGQRLRVVSAETGSATDALGVDPAVTWQRWPSFLPDGTSFVFTQASSDASKRGIFLGQVGSGRVTRLLDVVGNARVAASGHLFFTNNGVLMVAPFDLRTRVRTGEARVIASGLPVVGGHSWFSVSPAAMLVLPDTATEGPQASALQVFDRAGVQKRELGTPDRYHQIAASRNGRRLAIETDRPALDVLEIERGVRIPLGSVSPGMSFISPAWSSDGLAIAATQYAPGDQRNLAAVDTATGETTVLLETELARWPQAWAKHRREIVAIQWEPGGTSLWAIPADSPKEARRLSSEGAYTIRRASLSADDKWLAYDSNETGEFEVYVRPFDRSGERQRISVRGGSQPQWRDDGRELFYLESGGTLMAVPITPAGVPGPPVALFKLPGHPNFVPQQYVPLTGGTHFVVLVPSRTEGNKIISVLTDWTALRK